MSNLPNVRQLDSYQSSIFEKIPYNKHMRGPAITLFTRTVATSISQSGCQFVLDFSDNTDIIDRRFWLQLPVSVYAGAAIDDGCPKAFPVNSVIQNCSISFGANTINSTPSELVVPLQKYAGFKEYMSSWHMTPTQQDHVPNLANAAFGPIVRGYSTAATALTRTAANLVPDVFVSTESVQSPFLNTSTFSANDEEYSRGAFPKGGTGTKTGNGSGNKISYLFIEPLLSGFLADPDDQVGFCRVKRMTINLTWHSDAFNRIFSHPAAIADGVCTFEKTPELWYRTMTPGIDELPATVYTPLKNYFTQRHTHTTAVAANAVSTQIITPNINLDVIPSMLYIFGVPTTPATNHGGFFLIPNTISLTCGNKSSLLSDLNADMLWLLSKDNGLKQCNYVQSKKMGYPLCIDVAKDLNQRPGLRTNFNVQVKGTFRNPEKSPDDKFDIYVIAVQDGHLELTSSIAQQILGFSEQDISVLDMEEGESITEMTVQNKDTSGSGWNTHGGKFGFGDFMKVVKKVAPVALKVGAMAANTGIGKEVLGKIPIAGQVLPGLLNTASSMAGNGYQGRGLLGSGRMLN